MSNPQHEPTMEEILASIRKIISEDAPEAPAAEAPAPAAGTSSSAVAPPAAPAADVDEMARRLYEPLVARLRAELWLDRERAGVFGDG